MLDKKIYELATVYQSDSRKALLKGYLSCSALEVSGGNERTLTIRWNRRSQLFDDIGGYSRAQLVALRLQEDFDLCKVGDIQLAGGIDTAIAALSGDFGSFEAEGGEQMSDKNLKLFVVELKHLFEYG